MARTEFGMSARELLYETPEWEVDVLFRERNEEIKKAKKDAARR